MMASAELKETPSVFTELSGAVFSPRLGFVFRTETRPRRTETDGRRIGDRRRPTPAPTEVAPAMACTVTNEQWDEARRLFI